MSTTNTPHTWHYYIRQKGRNFYIGFADEDGNPPTTAGLTIAIWYTKFYKDVSSRDDELPIPEEFIHGLAMGCVYEFLRTATEISSRRLLEYKADFENMIDDAKRLTALESGSPMRFKPIDIRMDQQ